MTQSPARLRAVGRARPRSGYDERALERRVLRPAGVGRRPTRREASAREDWHPSVQAGRERSRATSTAAAACRDQLLGQWFARVVGLGHVLPPEHVRAALAADLRHNFRRDLADHASCQRTYALNDEAGLLLCTWPHGGRPALPLPLRRRGLDRHRVPGRRAPDLRGAGRRGAAIGRAPCATATTASRRNPWDEFECGHHYARALACWSLLLALCGFDYDAAQKRIAFHPRIQGDFRCFWSTGSAWGTCTRSSGVIA